VWCVVGDAVVLPALPVVVRAPCFLGGRPRVRQSCIDSARSRKRPVHAHVDVSQISQALLGARMTSSEEQKMCSAHFKVSVLAACWLPLITSSYQPSRTYLNTLVVNNLGIINDDLCGAMGS
jgi:hypothetical protein